MNGFKIQAEELLARYSKSKEVEIERLLNQYGGSLAEVREMYPQLLSAIEKRRLPSALPTEELFFTPTEAQSMGLALDEGWMLKFTPSENGGKRYITSLITPKKWEIRDDDVYISPAGERYTRVDLQNLLKLTSTAPLFETTEEPTPKAGYVWDSESGKFVPTAPEPTPEEIEENWLKTMQTSASAEVREGWAETSAQMRYETQIKEQQAKIEDIFGKVFPQQDVQEVMDYAMASPNDFLADILTIGRTRETESLLKLIEFSDEQIDELFTIPTIGGVAMKPLAQLPLGSYKLTDQPMNKLSEFYHSDPDLFRQAMLFEGRNEITEGWLRDGGMSKGEIDAYFQENLPSKFMRGEWLPDGVEDYWKMFWTGVGETIGTLSGLAKRVGQQGVAKELEKFGLEGRLISRDVEIAEPDTPQWYGQNIARMIPMMLALIDVSLITGGGGAGIVAAAGGGTTLQAIVGSITAGAVSSVSEGLMEASEAYNEAERRGMTEEERNQVFADVLRGNVAVLSASNTLQFGAGFFIPGGKSLPFLVKALIFGFEAASEGIEEGAQLAIARDALGEEQVWDEEMWQNVKLGIAGGLGFGTVSAIYNQVKGDVRNQMTSEQLNTFESRVTDYMRLNLSRAEAESKAWDDFAKTPEGGKLITDTVQARIEAETKAAQERAPEIKAAMDSMYQQLQNMGVPVAQSESVRELAWETIESKIEADRKSTLNKIREANDSRSVPVGSQFGVAAKGTTAGIQPTVGVVEPLAALPSNEEIIKGMLVPNWIRTTVKKISKVPKIGKVVEAGLGWRTLVKRDSNLTEDIVGRGAVVYGSVKRMGTALSNIEVGVLRSIISNPVRYFGFNNQGFSARMSARLLPEYSSQRDIAGTLEHVFTNPEMYNWSGIRQGLNYVTRFNLINKWVNNLLGTEELAVDAVNERWIHRVVTGKTVEGEVVEVRGRKGMSGGRPGTKPSYKRPRKFTTMAEGIQNHIDYEPNIEVSIGTYIEEAFTEIASSRFTKSVEEFGVTPSERLKERYPEVVERAELTKQELADFAKLSSVIRRAGRGEIIPTATLDEMVRKFPEHGRRLANIVSEVREERTTAQAVRELKEYPIRQGKLPTVRQIREILKKMPFEERATLRAQLLDLVSRTNDARAKRLLSIISDINSNPMYIPQSEPKPPEPEPGMPEAGLQQDIFGYQAPVTPKGKGEVTQISMDDYMKLADANAEANLPPPENGVKPQVEDEPGLEETTQAQQVKYTTPLTKTAAERRRELTQLGKEVNTLLEASKAPYWQAKHERARMMEIVSRPDIGENYLMMPFASGRIFDQGFVDSVNKFFGYDKGIAALQFTSDANAILRITKASLDFSAMMIQGLPSFGLAHSYLFTNPAKGVRLLGKWYKAYWDSTRAFFSPGTFYGFMAKNNQIAAQRISFGGSARSIDYFEALRSKGIITGGFRWITKKTGVFTLYDRAEIAFNSAGEIVRDEFWKILSPKAIEQGKGFELARHLDIITGLAESQAMGVPLTVRQLESSFAWFAPNYTRACLTVLSDIFRGGYSGAQARAALGGMLVAGSAYYTGIQLAMSFLSGKDEDEAWEGVKQGFGIREDPITGEVTWRPLSDFMGIKVGNYTFAPGGFWYGLVRLAGNITECISEVGDKSTIDLVTILKHGGLNKDNPFVYWWYTRSAPLLGTGFDLATHKDFLGYPIETPQEYAQYIMTRFEPIWMEQGINWMIPGLARDYEIPEGAARAAVPIFEIFGWRTIPESTWVRFYDRVNEKIRGLLPESELDPKQVDAWKAGKLGWGELTKKQKQDLIERDPELAALLEEAENDSKVRQTPEWEAYTERVDTERAIYKKRLDDLTAQLNAGEIDTREYRELAGDAGSNYGAIMASVARDKTYASIYEYFEKKDAEGSKYQFAFDLALAEYDTSIRFAEDAEIYLPNGDYNWDERDRRIDGFIEKWGQEMYDGILGYISGQKEEKGINAVWIRKAEDTENLGRGYWRLPYKPIMDMDAEDEAEGNIPAEYYNLWKTYQALPEEKRESFLERYPDLNKDWRAEYRKDNPEADARLALWGYSGKIQSMKAYNLVKQWGKELGIPLSQMGLGLPSDSLMPAYFNYSDVLREHSPSSPEAKLWRLENPEFNNWAMEQWGWQSTAEYKGMSYYRLQIKNKPFEAEYATIDSKDTEARAKYLAEHPQFKDDRNRLRGMDYEIPEPLLDSYVEYYRLERKGYENELFILDNPELYQVMVAKEIWKPKDMKPRAYYEIGIRIAPLEEEYSAIPSDEREARQKYLESHPGFRDDRNRLTAMDYGLEGDLVEDYVEYQTVERSGYADDLYLLDNPGFYNYMVANEIWQPREFKSREYYQIAIKIEPYEAEYGEIDADNRIARQKYLEDHPDFRDDRNRLKAMDYGLPDSLIEDFVEYNSRDWQDYEDEWWLMEHEEYYKAMYELGIWKVARDFSKVPTKEVWGLYQTYVGLPSGKPREDFRAKHPDLDAWLVLKYDYKPISERGNKEAEPTPWEVKGLVERFKDLFK